MARNIEVDAAFNGLNFVAAFKAAFAAQGMKERVSIEHMETFFFMVTAHKQRAVEMRLLQKALNYPQAKMHRTAGVLKALGWFEIEPSKEDSRQNEVILTETGLNFFEELTQSLSTTLERASPFEHRSRDMQEKIEEIAFHREAVSNLAGGQEKSEDTNSREARRGAISEEILNRRMLSKSRKEAQENAKMKMRDILMNRGEKEVEIGEKYIKTSRGIVTFPVLLKRTHSAGLSALAEAFHKMSDTQLDRDLTPNKKTKVERLQQEMEQDLRSMDYMVSKYGSEAVNEEPKLRDEYQKLKVNVSLTNQQLKLAHQEADIKKAMYFKQLNIKKQNAKGEKPALTRQEDWDKLP